MDENNYKLTESLICYFEKLLTHDSMPFFPLALRSTTFLLGLFAKNAFFGHSGDFQPGYEPN